MFTGHTAALKEFDGRFGLSVRQDCAFSYVGKLPTRLDKRIVPATKPVHLAQAVKDVGITGLVVVPDLAADVPEHLGLAIADNPVAASLALQTEIAARPGFQWASFETRIHPSVVIHPGAHVAEFDIEIGEGSIVHPNAVILPRTIIGRHCSIGPGTVVGTDAFEVDTSVDPNRVVSQSGGVRIGNHVDIQAKCTIVRATFGGFTELGDGTKLDCQVHFAHDCVAGRNVRIAACAELSGRVLIGDGTFIAPNVSISNGITIGAGAKVTIGAVVTRDVPDDATVTGHFAVEHRKWLSFIRTLK